MPVSPRLELEVIGQSVKGRDLYLAKYITDPDNPTILYLTQQHGNEQLTTEGALEFIKHLGTGKSQGVLDGVNISGGPHAQSRRCHGRRRLPAGGLHR